MPITSPDKCGERESVHRFLVAMIREAELQAELVDGFLKFQGVRSSRVPVDGDSSAFTLKRPDAEFVLSLGASLRLRQWERSNLASTVVPDLPAAGSVLAAASDQFCSGNRETSQDIPRQVVQVAVMHISRSGLEALGTDILLPTSFDTDVLIERLADLLWQYRHLIDGAKMEQR